jgi:hypothetical protein
MIEKNPSDIPINELSESIENIIDSIFEKEEKEVSEDKVVAKKPEEIEEDHLHLWELIPEDRVITKVKCFLKDEGISVEVNVEFRVEAIEGDRVKLSSPSLVFVWKCLDRGKEIVLFGRDGNYLIVGEVEEINLRKETLTVVLKGKPIKYMRQLFRVEVNPKEPIYLVMKIDQEPIVAKVNDINEEACSFIYKPLPILPGDIFGVVLRFPDGKKMLISDSEVITVRNRNDGLKTYVLKIKVPEKERSYLRRYLIERQREILNKLKEG